MLSRHLHTPPFIGLYLWHRGRRPQGSDAASLPIGAQAALDSPSRESCVRRISTPSYFSASKQIPKPCHTMTARLVRDPSTIGPVTGAVVLHFIL
ncbi:hypothetical protein PsYK624_135540 [Phanerochaete sordida]|uniref:Uncharacterized protein n=1 Tax=Phanerochaete sordida TaxID=48140 RepID=A0A9P3GK22_9APHY|nr:hypothetical protein PsYK624_135540 [Phanerochaete sordida]